MKTKFKLLLLLPLFALLMFNSCQKEVVEVTPPNDNEAVTAQSDLAKLVESTSTKDGSEDDVLDDSRCFTMKLPITVHVGNFRDIHIGTEADFEKVKAIMDENGYTREQIEFVFPITVVKSNYDEVIVENRDAFKNLIMQCNPSAPENEHIKCVDFKYPISFSIYNSDLQVIKDVTVGSDRDMYYFIRRVISSEFLAKIKFPVTMKLADGTEITVNNNMDLKNIIQDAREACVESSFTRERIINYLQECFWRVERIDFPGTIYIGTSLKFFPDNTVKLRVNGEDVAGTCQVNPVERGFVLKIMIEGRPELAIERYVTVLNPDLIELHSPNDGLTILKRYCPGTDQDLTYIDGILMNNRWMVEAYIVDGVNQPQAFYINTVNFMPGGKIVVTNPNNEVVALGSWLSDRQDGLNLGLNFGPNIPFGQLNHRWKIEGGITPDRIVLLHLNATGGIMRKLIIKKRI